MAEQAGSTDQTYETSALDESASAEGYYDENGVWYYYNAEGYAEAYTGEYGENYTNQDYTGNDYEKDYEE